MRVDGRHSGLGRGIFGGARRRGRTGAGVAVLLAVLGTSPLSAQDSPPAAPAPVLQSEIPAAPAPLAAPAPATPALTEPAAPAPAAAPQLATTPETPAPTATGSAEPVQTVANANAPASPAPDTMDLADPAAGATPGAAGAPAAAPEAGASSLIGHDLSPWGMFMAADIVVKSVMAGLAFASLVTWTICFAKTLGILLAQRRLRRGLGIILTAPDLETAGRALDGSRGPAAEMVAAARHESAASRQAIRSGGGPGLLQRVASHLTRIEIRAGRRLIAGTGLLATIGSTAPFVGLFGTVWGIMNSFIGISKSQTTNLAVVAPGIAEALLATAIGLVAAIPAVIIYNFFARWSAAYRTGLGDAAAGVERLVSRDFDHQRLEATVAFRQAAE